MVIMFAPTYYDGMNKVAIQIIKSWDVVTIAAWRVKWKAKLSFKNLEIWDVFAAYTMYTVM